MHKKYCMILMSCFLITVCSWSQHLHTTIDKDSYQDLMFLLGNKRWTIDEKNEQGWTPLYHSIIDNKIDIATTLIRNGANVNALNGRGYQFTALYSASEKGLLPIVKLLIDYNALIDKGDSYGCTPLCAAIAEKRTDVAQYLISRGANCKEPNKKNGKSPLHIATQQKQPEIIKLLIERGAEINGFTSIPSYRVTPLQLAVVEGEYSIVKYLLDNGADANAYCGKGMTALDEALYRSQSALIQLLQSYGARTSKELQGTPSGVTDYAKKGSKSAP